MPMRFTELSLPGVILVETQAFVDHRGHFMELYRTDYLKNAKIDTVFVQDNYSHSRYGVLRGLHYQLRNAQAKLVCVIKGKILDVAVDIRIGSPTFGRHVMVSLGEGSPNMIYIPEGMAHGFLVLSETADVLYKCSRLYDPSDEFGIAWNDPDLAIPWPVNGPILSEKDGRLPRLRDISKEHLPRYVES